MKNNILNRSHIPPNSNGADYSQHQQWVDRGGMSRLLNISPTSIKTIVDVGAKLPTPIHFWNRFSPDLLLCFEPHIQNFENINNHPVVSSNKNIEVYPFACGDYDGEGVLNLADNPSGCSLKSFDFTFVGTQPTKVIRLEEFLKNRNIKKVDLIKADTQGGDYEVLLGCGDYLKTVEIVLVEVWFRDITRDGGYKNVATFDKVWSLLGSFGLELHSFPSLMYRSGSLEWGDALFYRR